MNDLPPCTVRNFQHLKSTSVFLKYCEDCSKKFEFIKYFDHYVNYFQGKHNFLLLLAVIIIPFTFLNIKLNADQFVSTAIVRIQKRLKISSLIAAFTLLPLANGAPDTIVTFVTARGEESSADVAVGTLVSSFVFASTVVMGYVILCSKKAVIQVPSPTVMKEIGFFFLLYTAVISLALLGKTNSYLSAVPLIIFVAYIACSIYLAKRSESVEEKEIAAENSEVDNLAYSSLFASAKDYLYESESPISSIILLPFKVLYMFTIPNVENPFSNHRIRYIILMLGGWVFMFSMGITSNVPALYLVPPLFSLLILGLMQVESVVRNKVFIFDLITLLISIAWIKFFSTVLIDNINLVSFVVGRGRTFLSLIIISLGNSMPDLFANGAISAAGESVMALVGCLSSQFANFALGVAIFVFFSKTGKFDLFGLKNGQASAEKNLMRIIFLFAIGSLCCVLLTFSLAKGFTRAYASVCFVFYLCFLLITAVYSFSGA